MGKGGNGYAQSIYGFAAFRGRTAKLGVLIDEGGVEPGVHTT
jgi:hypothetical protein